MVRDGLVLGGLKRWMPAFARRLRLFVFCLATLPACGSEEGHKKLVQCRLDADCQTSELGECDVATCEEGRCVLDTKPDGHRCDDTDPLTGEDACVSGICAGIVKTCEDSTDPCLKAVYDPETDECQLEPVDDGVPCDDGSACTQSDTCQAGACVGDEPKQCEAVDACHVEGECDPETGECSEPLAEDGTACDDAQTCTADDVCQAGVCAGAPVACDDGLTCSVDSCDEGSGACVADMSQCTCVADQDCDDGNLCNGVETCNPTQKLCQVGSPVVCGASLDPCLKNVCVAETGECEPEPVVDGTWCDDANACTASDRCSAGSCVGSEPVVCTPLSQCHVAGTCDKITGACSNPEKAKNSPCSDGNACSATDTCQAGVCVGVGATTCSAIDQCHDAGVCDTATGICSKPVKQNGVTCNDANPCTKGDACQNGTCTPASQVTCEPLDACHSAGVCDVKTGLCSSPTKADGTSCSDGLLCTTTDVCAGGKCVGAKVTCDDKVACTRDSCSEVLGGCTVDSSACACKTSADCDDGNPCNGVETCDVKNLTCVRGTAVSCVTLDDACNVGTCDTSTGACVATPKQNGTTCDDGDKCTQTSSCQSGVCRGANAVTCTASDQCHTAGTCNPSTGICSNPAKANGSTCNDGNACTQTDSCQSGVCSGSNAIVCVASDQCHTAGTCDASTGVCSNPAKTNGSTCSDGNACTQTDTCQGGVCTGASPVTCTASDQCHSAGTCDTSTGVCSNPLKKDGTACNDGNACTRTDTCVAGACSGASPVTCTASDQCHTAGTCDTSTGACSNPAKKDGTACNDNDLCTQTDACSGGRCKGANPVTCTAADQCHDAGTCDPTTGTCSTPSKPDSTPCNDGKGCTSSDVCTKGVCGGVAVTCDDKIACTVDSCVEPNGCNFDTSKCGCAKDADCVDADKCNGVETCDLTTLTCKRGTPVSCASLDDACNVGTCNSSTGACSATPRRDGTGCDDGNACTKSDGCVAGKCVGASPVTCAASDQCHDVGSCDPKTGACSNPNKTDGATCDDGNKCTRTDTCKTGVCSGANAVTCTASDQCHSAGTCDPTTGVCSNPVKTGACDDGDKCTQTDSCQNGVCTGANPVVCSASDQCHNVGTCDSKTGTCSNPSKTDGTLCDDSNKCTTSDTCQAGKCTGAKPITCSALGQCYAVGTCDTATGICSNPFANAGTSCSDSDACTTADTCDGKGNCSGGTKVICSPPKNTCQVNTCDKSLGCQLGSKPNGTSCDDQQTCTQFDVCYNGDCSGGIKRSNALGDWADDPGAPKPVDGLPTSTGPTSVDLFTDKEGNAHGVGTYVGTIAFNDKDVSPPATTLALPGKSLPGIYWVKYSEAGAVLSLGSLGGVGRGGTLTVSHATSHSDGSFTLVGTVLGSATFGLNGKVVNFDATKGPFVYVVHYLPTGDYAWHAYFIPASQSSFTVDSVASFDDDALIVIGANAGGMKFVDAKGTTFGSADELGVWAARLGADGVGQWGRSVVIRGATTTAQAVTTHEDGSASLTGGFTGKALLGPSGDIPVSTLDGEKGQDIWFEKLDKSGKLQWGGRVGGSGSDVPGDVAPVSGGGLLLLANTAGATPNVSDGKSTQQLLHATAAGLQVHVLSLDADGIVVSDGLIANPESGVTRGWQLKRDLDGFYTVAGTFASSTRFWSKVGFGSGAPGVAADITISSVQKPAGSSTLFVARVDPSSYFRWARQVGGDNSGLATSPWDVVLTAHPTHSATIAGIFNQTAVFGDQVTESLNSWLDATGAPSPLGSPFVVHLNSQAEYDYCP